MFELFHSNQELIRLKVMVYNKHRQVENLFEIDYFQFLWFCHIKAFKGNRKKT